VQIKSKAHDFVAVVPLYRKHKEFYAHFTQFDGTRTITSDVLVGNSGIQTRT